MKAEMVDYVIRICGHVYKAVRLAAIGFENETAEESDMPLRVMSYDAAGYRAQISNGSDGRYPVVSLVLYYGYKKNGARPKHYMTDWKCRIS